MLGRAVVLCVALAACGSDPATRAPARTPAMAAAAPRVALRFMKAATGPKARNELRRWSAITSAQRVARLEAMANNEPAHFALALYAEAWKTAGRPGTPTLHVALEPGGNYARHGFVLVSPNGEETTHPALPYLILSEDAEAFRGTLLHETGHALHALLVGAGGRARGEPLAPIPHTTAAITDRRTAFNEGFAIHLETLNAHCGRDRRTRSFYDRGALVHGRAKRALRSEYYAAIKDMLSYAQTFARYQHVRDGLYAFAPAATGDYLRLQLTPARDRRTLRGPGELMASEGFVASVLFQLIAGRGCASLPELVPRYRPLLLALRHAETSRGALDASPLLDLIDAARTEAVELGARAVRVFLDLSHGVTMDAGATVLWQRLHDAALGIDRAALMRVISEIEKARARWEREALASTARLGARVGPVLGMKAPGVKVGLAMFGEHELSFDLNAVSAAILALVPAIGAARAEAVVSERERAFFRDVADFRARTRALGIADTALVPLREDTPSPPRPGKGS